MIKSYKDLEIYKESYVLAMDVFWLTRKFPKEEMYSLISQVVRSSRSITANIVEGWAKRVYEGVFKQHLIHALSSNEETENWLCFAKDCGYISEDEFDGFACRIQITGRKLTRLHQNWKNYGK